MRFFCKYQPYGNTRIDKRENPAEEKKIPTACPSGKEDEAAAEGRKGEGKERINEEIFSDKHCLRVIGAFFSLFLSFFVVFSLLRCLWRQPLFAFHYCFLRKIFDYELLDDSLCILPFESLAITPCVCVFVYDGIW